MDSFDLQIDPNAEDGIKFIVEKSGTKVAERTIDKHGIIRWVFSAVRPSKVSKNENSGT